MYKDRDGRCGPACGMAIGFVAGGLINAGIQYYNTGCIDLYQAFVAALAGATGGGFGSYIGSLGFSTVDNIVLNIEFGGALGAGSSLITGGDPYVGGAFGAAGNGLGSITGQAVASGFGQGVGEALGQSTGAAVGESGNLTGLSSGYSNYLKSYIPHYYLDFR